MWSGNANSRTQGVALAVDQKYASSITLWKALGPRLLYARLKHSYGFMSIFSCYAPTDIADTETKDSFYTMLMDELRLISRHDIVLILGDMNATLGPDRAGLAHIVGPHTFQHTNDNGRRMLDLCASFNLKCLSTWFQHRPIHRYTWYSNTGTTAKAIDHILISGRWRIASDCRVRRSAELGNTDHRMLSATLHLHLHRSKPTSSCSQFPDTDKLRLPQLAQLYSIKVANRFDTLNEVENLNEAWRHITTTMVPIAIETLGKRRSKKQPWISSETLDLVDRCRETRLRSHTATYRELSRLRRRSLRRDRTAWLHKIADTAERDFRTGNTRSAFKSIKALSQAGNHHHTSPLVSSDGTIVTEPAAKLRCWQEHYTSALCKPPPPPCSEIHDFAEAGVPDGQINLEPPSVPELEAIIKKLPSGRAPGADGITGELMKAALGPISSRLHRLCRRIWEEERVPAEWKEGVIVSFYKRKGDIRNPANYRPITLLSTPSKVITSAILRRIQPLLLAKRRPQQAGFTPGRSTADCILSLRLLAQHRREFRQPLYTAYVDLRAAFDSLDRHTLWLLLQGIGVPSKLLNIIRDLYTDTTCRVRADRSISDPFPTTSGVRQGCVAAPNLFNVAVDYWLKKTLERCPNLGISQSEPSYAKITDLCYADDVSIFAELLDTISNALEILSEEASPLGLSVNWAKTKIQSLSDFLSPLPSTIQMNNSSIEAVTEFIYLGSKITSDCSSSEDIDRRIRLAFGSFGRLHKVWRSSKIRNTTKIRVLNTCILPILTYASETWTLSAAQSQSIDVFHRKCLRNILGIRWFHHVTNEEIYTRAGNPTRLSTIIKRSRLRLLGHVACLPEDVQAHQILVGASPPPPPS